MFYTRRVPTKSGSFAVQVVCYQHRKTIIVKHIGSSRLPDEINDLEKIARGWIEKKPLS